MKTAIIAAAVLLSTGAGALPNDLYERCGCVDKWAKFERLCNKMEPAYARNCHPLAWGAFAECKQKCQAQK